MDAEMRALVQDVCRAACRVEGLTPDEPIMEWESEAVSYRPSDPVWTRYVTEEMCAALDRIFAAGFEAAKEMAAQNVESGSPASQDMVSTHIDDALRHAAACIRALQPSEAEAKLSEAQVEWLRRIARTGEEG